MLIPAKFPSKCSMCGEPIQVGEQISWRKGSPALHAGCSSEGLEAAKTLQASRATDADVELVAPEGRAYMPFQRAGIAFLMARGSRGVLLGDQQGLGKTIQVLGWINNEPKIASVLVICPKSLVLNWIREARAWLIRDMRPTMIPGLGSFVVCSYEQAKKLEKELDRPWDAVVVDEGHYCKNPKAARTKLVQRLMERGARRAVLTGTPIPNRPIEVFPLLAMVSPEDWDPNGKGFFRFAQRYAGAYQGSWGWDFSGASNLDELQQKMRSTCLLRRKKEDVLTELPPKCRQVIELPATGAQGAVRAERDAWERIEARLESLRVAVELSKASDDPADFAQAVGALNKVTAVAFTEISKQRHAVALAKVPQAIEHAISCLEDDEAKKLIIWTHHHDVADQIREGLREFGVVGIDGRNSTEERQASVDAFQTRSDVRVFVGGITAAGVGITLTAADHEIFVELDWVPGNMQQAEDRAHRIGQTNSVLVQMLVLEGSLDARMAHVLVEKMAIADAGLDAPLRLEHALPVSAPPATAGSLQELAATASSLSASDVASIHDGLRRLAGVCDGAHAIDGNGFSKIDTAIGHSLARAPRLSPKQAALGLRLCRKYRRQLGSGIWSQE